MQGCHVAFVCTDIPPFNTLDVLLPPVSLYQVEGSMCYLMMTFFATYSRGANIVTTMRTCSKNTCIPMCT
jgi:hypothetical protein